MKKSHKKVIKHVNSYLIHGVKPGGSKDSVHDVPRDASYSEAGHVPSGETPCVDSTRETTKDGVPQKPSDEAMCVTNEVASSTKPKNEYKKGRYISLQKTITVIYNGRVLSLMT